MEPDPFYIKTVTVKKPYPLMPRVPPLPRLPTLPPLPVIPEDPGMTEEERRKALVCIKFEHAEARHAIRDRHRAQVAEILEPYYFDVRAWTNEYGKPVVHVPLGFNLCLTTTEQMLPIEKREKLIERKEEQLKAKFREYNEARAKLYNQLARPRNPIKLKVRQVMLSHDANHHRAQMTPPETPQEELTPQEEEVPYADYDGNAQRILTESQELEDSTQIFPTPSQLTEAVIQPEVVTRPSPLVRCNAVSFSQNARGEWVPKRPASSPPKDADRVKTRELCTDVKTTPIGEA